MVRATKNILLTGARSPVTLDLARQLNRCGHSVYAADSSFLHICRFSKASKKSLTLPSPRFQEEAFVEKLLSVVNRYGIDLYIPTCEEIIAISKHLHRFPCAVFSEPFEKLKVLHNKWLFNIKLRSQSLPVPETHIVRNEAELRALPFTKPYILKPAYSRATQNIYIVRNLKKQPSLAYTPNNPWVAQEFIEGNKYCSYTICHNGEITAHAVYPVTFSIDNSSCLSFQSSDHPEIFRWVQNFVRAEQFTGQIAFDFIERDGTVYAIECNPRATSGIHLFKHTDRIDLAFLKQTNAIIVPQIHAKRQIAVGMMMYGWRDSRKGFFKSLLSTSDVIFSWRDIKPFLYQPVLFLHYLSQAVKYRGSMASIFHHDLEWNGE